MKNRLYGLLTGAQADGYCRRMQDITAVLDVRTGGTSDDYLRISILNGHASITGSERANMLADVQYSEQSRNAAVQALDTAEAMILELYTQGFVTKPDDILHLYNKATEQIRLDILILVP